MALQVGSPIVKDGLLLHLDAADSLNYTLSEVEVLVVGGGGGGGVCYGGGGGGGAVIYNTSYPVTPGNAITVTVGNGGTNRVNVVGDGGPGQNSSFGNIVAPGGGYGGGNCGNVGGNGASGGGGSSNGSSNTAGGTGIIGLGYDGEASIVAGGGGGGGAGGQGYGRHGGRGLAYSISGKLQYYGGGGSGGGSEIIPGGIGGGGLSGTALPAGNADAGGANGVPNTGGGGGGSIISGTTGTSGVGGSGIVIVRYPGPQKATGGNTITSVGGYTIHTFTSSGTFTPLTAPTNGSTIYGLQDLSNNCNTAFAVNGPTYSSDGSIFFDGINDKLTFPNNTIPIPLGITVEVWFKTSSSTKYQDIFDLDDSYGIWITTNGAGTTGKITASFQTLSGYMTANYIANTWYQVVISGFGNSNFMYLNGVQVATSNQPVVSSINLNGARVGNVDGDRASEYFVGNVSSLKIYNRALSASEIQQNFNALRWRYGI